MATNALAPRDNMLEWERAGAVTKAMRAIKASPNEATVDQQTRACLPKFSENPYYLLLNFMKVVLGEDERAWSYFAGNLNHFAAQLGAGGAAAIRADAQAIWDRHGILVGKTGTGTLRSLSEKQPAKRQDKPKEKIPTPQLDAAIDLTDGLSNMGLPASVQAALKGVKSALELARAAKQKEESSAVYMRHIADLSSAVFQTIGEVVKAAGQDVQLAAQAAGQLGKIAKIFGGMGNVLTAVTAIQKIVYGKDRGEKIDAAIDLLTTLGGTVGVAAGISLNAFKWIWNTIGVPVKDLTEEIGLAAVFDGKSADALKAEFDTLAASEPKVARWAIGRMRYKVFQPRASPFAPNWNTRDAWERVLRDGNMLQIDIRVADALRRGYTPGSDPIVDDLIVGIKDRYRKLAHQFIDSVVAEAKSWK